MDISLIIKIAGIGLLISVSTHMLKGSGRDEQSMMVTLAGILVVLSLLMSSILFKEKINAKCIIGICLSFVALLMINLLK